MPRVTVAIATYNWATVLPWSIGSVLDQTFTDFEVLVVGDACTDESAEVVTAIGDPRVQWVNLERNCGHQSGPNNEAIRRSSGDVIAYLGHDDLWAPRHLEHLVDAVDAGAPFVHSSVLLVHPTRPPSRFPAPGWSFGPDRWIPPTSVAHTRSLIDAVGGWRDVRDTGADDPDGDLWRRMAARSAPVLVPHLDCVKLSAARRHNVYRTRPCDEQRYWLDRLRASTDPEQLLIDACEQPYALAVPQPPPSFAARSRTAVRKRVRRVLGRPPTTAVDRLKERRRYKGLPGR